MKEEKSIKYNFKIFMKKNIIFIITWIILFGIIFLLIPIALFFWASKLLESWKVELAGKIFSQLSNIFPQNASLELKKADVFYKEENYHQALIKYLQVKCRWDEMCFILNHNLWNTLYRFGETFEEKEQKKKFWQQSLWAYQEALSYKMDLQTEQNYEFVLKKLKELEEPPPPESQSQQQEQKKQDEKDQEKNEEEKQSKEKQQEQQPQENNQEEKNPEQNQDQNWQPWETPTNPNTGIGWEVEEIQKPLSQEEQKQIEQYLEWLKQEEKQNQEFNKPWKKDSLWWWEAFELFEDNKKNTDW